ncbi:MAG: glycosyltransferase, partial [Ignavibacteriales bacterium]|nr:glycosyltransferase [Ignavibacteriales bacterium]
KNIYLFIEKFLSLFTKNIIAVSKGEFRDLAKNKICNKKKLIKIDNGIKIQDISVSFPKKNEKFRIATITRFDYQKNTELLIEVLNELNKNEKSEQFEFIIIGTGEKENLIKDEIEKIKTKINVIFTGGITDTHEILRDCHCYISTSRWEGLPLAVLEAMSNGLPVVATNVVGNKDILIHNQNGFLFDINKPNEASKYIIKLSNDNSSWQEFSVRSKQTIKNNFSLEQMLEKTQNLYETILSEE